MAARPLGTLPTTSARPSKLTQKRPVKLDAAPPAHKEADTAVAANLLSLQHNVGNRAVQRYIQAKLSVGPAQDKYEEEADRVADRVTQSPAVADKARHAIQRQSLGQSITPLVKTEKAFQDEGRITRKPADAKADSAGFNPGSGFARQLGHERGGGTPLPHDTRAEMESKFGVNFSPVRIHTGAKANSLTKSIGAEAFTNGTHIYLGSGRFQPNSVKGKHLLAHELTHVVQQSAGVQRQVNSPDVLTDTEADHLNRKKVFRQFDFLKMRHKRARLVKQVLSDMKLMKKDMNDPTGHWWTELSDTSGGKPLLKQSYGMWPSKGPDDDQFGAGVPGRANAFGKTPKGSKERDPYHGQKTDEEFHPVVEVDQSERYDRLYEGTFKQIKSFAHGYKDRWKWRSRWGTNTMNFQNSLMRKFKMEIPKKNMPMLYHPKFMMSSEAQENMESAKEYGRVQEAFMKFADEGGKPLGEVFSEGGVSTDEFMRAFDVTPEEQQARAELLAQLNPQVTVEQLLAMAKGK